MGSSSREPQGIIKGSLAAPRDPEGLGNMCFPLQPQHCLVTRDPQGIPREPQGMLKGPLGILKGSSRDA